MHRPDCTSGSVRKQHPDAIRLQNVTHASHDKLHVSRVDSIAATWDVLPVTSRRSRRSVTSGPREPTGSSTPCQASYLAARGRPLLYLPNPDRALERSLRMAALCTAHCQITFPVERPHEAVSADAVQLRGTVNSPLGDQLDQRQHSPSQHALANARLFPTVCQPSTCRPASQTRRARSPPQVRHITHTRNYPSASCAISTQTRHGLLRKQVVQLSLTCPTRDQSHTPSAIWSSGESGTCRAAQKRAGAALASWLAQRRSSSPEEEFSHVELGRS